MWHLIFAPFLPHIKHWIHDNVIKWTHYPRYWSLCEGSPHKGQWRGVWCFLLSAPEQTVEQTIEMLVIWDAITLILTSLFTVVMKRTPDSPFAQHMSVQLLNVLRALLLGVYVMPSNAYMCQMTKVLLVQIMASLSSYSAPSHCLKKRWPIVHWTFGNNFGKLESKTI